MTQALAPVRIKIENVFACLKKFWALTQKIRIPIDLKEKGMDYILGEHQKRWIICCSLINRGYLRYSLEKDE